MQSLTPHFQTFQELTLTELPELLIQKFAIIEKNSNPVLVYSRTIKLKQISANEVFNLRITSKAKPTFVLKKENLLFVGTIPRELNCSFILKPNEHLCSKCGKCYALSSINGGCPKVLDELYSEDFFDQVSQEFKKRVIENSKRVEKYSFIRNGFQTFNQDPEKVSFGVMECDNFSFKD